jgi:hypothetical protein
MADGIRDERHAGAGFEFALSRVTACFDAIQKASDSGGRVL